MARSAVFAKQEHIHFELVDAQRVMQVALVRK